MKNKFDCVMTEQKSSTIKMLMVVGVLILTLPLFYFLVAKVLLPLEWDEPQFQNDTQEQPQ